MDPHPPKLDDDYLDAVLIGGREEREVLMSNTTHRGRSCMRSTETAS